MHGSQDKTFSSMHGKYVVWALLCVRQFLRSEIFYQIYRVIIHLILLKDYFVAAFLTIEQGVIYYGVMVDSNGWILSK